jgi:hypothetical protein
MKKNKVVKVKEKEGKKIGKNAANKDQQKKSERANDD